MIYPKEFENLIESFKKLPGVGEKSAERFVYSIDNLDENEIEEMVNNLIEFKKNIRRCSVCGHYTNLEQCAICTGETRDRSIICVVEDSKSVFMFEKSGTYKGLYHVLGGLISPIDDVNPEDLNIDTLINRRITEEVKEVVIAINPSIQGETTSLYIQKLLENKKVKVSRLSYGIPLGSDLEYMDPLTLIKALDDRKYIS